MHAAYSHGRINLSTDLEGQFTNIAAKIKLQSRLPDVPEACFKGKSTLNDLHINICNQYAIFSGVHDLFLMNKLAFFLSSWYIFTMVIGFLHYPQCYLTACSLIVLPVGFIPSFMST